ncbi:MAG: type II toxin-antitoxin system HicA family toxin [Candidatus Micrarchaeota archaeon]|nr:type II toxin-antitoxin system HicA family toxin [Candidatus Micrarchaeota archaeon]
MPKIPRNLPGLQVIKILSKMGFHAIRQKGSHVVLEKIIGMERWGCVVPLHKDLKVGTLKGILKQAKISEDEFFSFL